MGQKYLARDGCLNCTPGMANVQSRIKRWRTRKSSRQSSLTFSLFLRKMKLENLTVIGKRLAPGGRRRGKSESVLYRMNLSGKRTRHRVDLWKVRCHPASAPKGQAQMGETLRSRDRGRTLVVRFFVFHPISLFGGFYEHPIPSEIYKIR